MMLSGKTALVTGARGGIGRAIVTRFLREGATLEDRYTRFGFGCHERSFDVEEAQRIAGLLQNMAAESCQT